MRIRINCVEEKRDCHKLRRKILNIEHPKTNTNLITIQNEKHNNIFGKQGFPHSSGKCKVIN